MFGRLHVVYQPKRGKIGKNLNLYGISRFRSLKNRASLKTLENLQEGPGVMGSTEVRPSTPNCMGYLKLHFFRKKTQKFSNFYSPFSQRSSIVG